MATEQPNMHLLYRHIDDQNAALDKQALRLKLMHGRTRAPEEIAGIGCPVLLIANDEDSVIPPVVADGIAAVAPNARAVHIPDAAHSGYFERPDVFNSLVGEFIATLG
jgi:3-oxoadipate enol-lactonase